MPDDVLKPLYDFIKERAKTRPWYKRVLRVLIQILLFPFFLLLYPFFWIRDKIIHKPKESLLLISLDGDNPEKLSILNALGFGKTDEKVLTLEEAMRFNVVRCTLQEFRNGKLPQIIEGRKFSKCVLGYHGSLHSPEIGNHDSLRDKEVRAVIDHVAPSLIVGPDGFKKFDIRSCFGANGINTDGGVRKTKYGYGSKGGAEGVYKKRYEYGTFDNTTIRYDEKIHYPYNSSLEHFAHHLNEYARANGENIKVKGYEDMVVFVNAPREVNFLNVKHCVVPTEEEYGLMRLLNIGSLPMFSEMHQKLPPEVQSKIDPMRLKAALGDEESHQLMVKRLDYWVEDLKLGINERVQESCEYGKLDKNTCKSVTVKCVSGLGKK